MRQRIIWSVIGGAVLFGWGFLGHAILRIYDPAFSGFVDESAIAQILEANAPTSGLYYLPIQPDYSGPATTEAFVNYVEAGDRTGFAVMSLRGFLIQVISVFLVLSLLIPGANGTYWWVVARFASIGFLLSFAIHGYYWNWFDFPDAYLGLALVDGTVGWALVGLLVGLRGRGSRSEARVDPRP